MNTDADRGLDLGSAARRGALFAVVAVVVAVAVSTLPGIDDVRDRLAEQSRVTAAAGFQSRLLSRLSPAVYQSVALLVLLTCLAVAYAIDLQGIGDLSAVVVLLVLMAIFLV